MLMEILCGYITLYRDETGQLPIDVKRLARETFRVHRTVLSGVDLVVRARSVVLSASSAQARAEILDLMQRAHRQCCAGADASPQS